MAQSYTETLHFFSSFISLLCNFFFSFALQFLPLLNYLFKIATKTVFCNTECSVVPPPPPLHCRGKNGPIFCTFKGWLPWSGGAVYVVVKRVNMVMKIAGFTLRISH